MYYNCPNFMLLLETVDEEPVPCLHEPPDVTDPSFPFTYVGMF